MNLRIDLLLESERRSASAFNLQAVMRVLSIVIPAVLVLGIALVALSFYQLKLEAERLNNVWTSMEPQKEQAERLRNQVSMNQKILEELKGMARSNQAWQKQLTGLMEVTPLNVQLRRFAVSQSVHLDRKEFVRIYRMTVEGKAVGPTSDRAVATLKERFLSAPPFASKMNTATVSSFGMDPSANADRDDRAFHIDCEYKPLHFNETSGR